MPDFFAWSKILPLILYPLPAVLLLLIVLSWWTKPYFVRWIIRAAVAFLWILSTPLAADFLLGLWQPPLKHRADLPAVSDAAVVLGGLSDGAVTDPEHLDFNGAAERLTEAVQLWREGRVKVVLITSGSGTLSRPQDKEAPGLARWARQAGVPEEALLVESESRNTRENALFSLPLLEGRGLKSVVLITSAVHMPRSEAIFRKAGYAREGRSLVTWPVDRNVWRADVPFCLVPDPSTLGAVQGLLKEALGFAVYRVFGYL